MLTTSFKSFIKSIFLVSSRNNAAGCHVGIYNIPFFSIHFPLLAVIPYSCPKIFFNAKKLNLANGSNKFSLIRDTKSESHKWYGNSISEIGKVTTEKDLI